MNKSTLFLIAFTYISTTFAMESKDLYLVVHDNKVKQEEKIGHSLPRLGIVNIQTGDYLDIVLDPNTPLAQANDLESLQWTSEGYIACESKGRCYQFDLHYDREKGYIAQVVRLFLLPVPTDRFFNIEAIAIREGGMGPDLCWSHRGGIFAGEEPWTRCASLDLSTGEIGSFVESLIEDPFGTPNQLNRAISDHAIGPRSGQNYFIATIDTEGSEGIEGTSEDLYSILYTDNFGLHLFPKEKIEALFINDQESLAVLGTDNEAAGSKVCQFSLESGFLSCVDVRKGEAFGIGGIAPLHINSPNNRHTGHSE